MSSNRLHALLDRIDHGVSGFIESWPGFVLGWLVVLIVVTRLRGWI